MANNRAVVGVFHTEEEALRAINRLHSMGYTRDEISILAKDPDRFPRLDEDRDINVETPGDVGKGAATGAATGGVLGGLGALVAELGILAIPGVGPFLAAGPIAATIGGLLAGGAIGGAIGALVGLGVEKEEAKVYEQNLNEGAILVIVDADDNRYDDVRTTLRPHDTSYRDDRLTEHDLHRDRLGTDGMPVRDRDYEGLDRRDTLNEHLDRDRPGNPIHRDDPSLKERMDRDDDGRLDLDDLRKNPRDTDDKL